MSRADAPLPPWRASGREAIRSLVRLAPPPGPRWGIALRSAFALALPLAVLTPVGFPGLGLQMSTGAFTAIYLTGLPVRERAKALPVVGLGMVASAALGAALTPWLWTFVAGLIVLSIGVGALAFAFRIGPPGPVFFVLTYGLAANITAVVDGERRADPWVFVLMIAAGSVFSYLVSISPLLLRSARRAPARPLREILPGPWIGSGERVLLARIAIVALVGSAVSVLWLDPARTYWTVATGVTVIGIVAVRSLSVSRGLHRTVGTLVGAVLYLLLAPLGASPVLLIVLLFVLQFGIEFFVVRNYALALAFVTPLVLLINATASGLTDVSAIALERVLDTLVGSALGMLTVVLHGRRKADPSESA